QVPESDRLAPLTHRRQYLPVRCERDGPKVLRRAVQSPLALVGLRVPEMYLAILPRGGEGGAISGQGRADNWTRMGCNEILFLLPGHVPEANGPARTRRDQTFAVGKKCQVRNRF